MGRGGKHHKQGGASSGNVYSEQQHPLMNAESTYYGEAAYGSSGGDGSSSSVNGGSKDCCGSFCSIKNMLYVVTLSTGLIAIIASLAIVLGKSESDGGGFSNIGSNLGSLAMLVLGALLILFGGILWLVDACCLTVAAPRPAAL